MFADNEQVGRFGLIREIARGGMGQVFLARDTKLGRRVAIKFLLQNDPSFVSRFLVEARATARCTHENIVTIHEVGEHGGLPYMVLEYLEGKTLQDVLRSPITAAQLVELLIPVVRALERAHEHGIVHRDLKPSNVFVTDRGQVKVLDFGVARVFDTPEQRIERGSAAMPAVDEAITHETDGSLVGTLPYMSPEQWGADEIDHLSDIWAVGILFWRALAGVHPAGTADPNQLRTVMLDLDRPMPSIAARVPAMPPALVAIVDRCLQKRKARRYQSATDVARDLQAFAARRTDHASADECPYRGLAAFDEGDAKFFFGRSGEIRSAVAQLETWPLLAVVGPSGVGKSSFVHAGLVPAVRATGNDWQVCVVRPGRAPLQRLAVVLDDVVATGDTPHDPAALRDAPGLFGNLLRQHAMRRRQRVLIVIDQLEELFTLSDDAAARELFLAALLGAADDASAPVRVVLSMRADFLDRLAGHKQFLADLSRGLFFLSAPDRDNLREAIVRPAELAGYTFEDAWIVDDMLQVATSRGALPLLSFAASRLWDARDRAGSTLTVAAYNEMGGVGGAFARHADAVVAAIPPTQHALLRAIVTRLVTPEGTRAVVDQSELTTLGDGEHVEQILDRLVQARLVQLQADPTHGSTVEIVHEVLIDEWPTLQRWLDDGQALRGFLQELRQAARQWASRGRPNDLVWRDATARDALRNADRNVLELSAIERDFLHAMRAQLRRQRRRRVLALVAISAALALVFAGGAVSLVRISQAEQDAQQKAIDADRAAGIAKASEAKAHEAEAKVQAQLDAVRAAEASRAAAERGEHEAETKAQAADAEVAQSKDELQKSNEELKRALAGAQQEKAKAVAAADLAKRASDDAKTANAKLEANLAKEREHVKRLEAERQKIYSGGLQ
ncbi:MAG TPA: protein kinase [Kofleriaceae bacterium]|nr:protein kinase [Kofleriaceae bacterium]